MDPFLEQLDPLQQLRDDRVAFRHRLRKLRHHLARRFDLRCTRRLDLHSASISIESWTCNLYFKQECGSGRLPRVDPPRAPREHVP